METQIEDFYDGIGKLLDNLYIGARKHEQHRCDQGLSCRQRRLACPFND
jgi:hypothetical protein